MAPLDLETRLAEDLHRAAEAAGLQPASLDAVRADAVRQTRRHRIQVAALAAAAAVVVAAGTAALVARQDADRDHTDIGRPPTTEPAPTTEPTTPTTEAPATTTPPPATSPSTTAAPVVPATPTSAVIEGLDLRADGIGPFDFGASPDEVLPALIAELGVPVHDDVLTDLLQPCTRAAGRAGPAIDPAWRTVRSVLWNGLSIDFIGPDPSSLRLVGWYTLIGPDQPRHPRMADGGPTIGDPLSAWQAFYGAQLEMNLGTAIVHLPEGDVIANFGDTSTDASAGAMCDPRDV
jgi:hypothetical protein